jgi:pyruvate formate lyase activating enzyme
MDALDSLPEAIVFDINRNSTHDGPGIRTTVFLSGCPLHCRWCQNPESQQSTPGVWWFDRNCIGCLSCIEACANHALSHTTEGIVIDRSRCGGCQACVGSCPARAMQPIGLRRNLGDLLAEVEKDRIWYEASGGGVTLSGGEPCSQPEFAVEFLAGCRRRGLHTALDTCGEAHATEFARILDHVDLLLFDLKHCDDAAHRELTGAGLATIHANLRHAALRARQREMKLWIRTPLIPGASADAQVLAAIGEFLKSELDGAVERWELCAFNPSCRTKYGRLGMQWQYADLGLQSEAETAALLAVARGACGCAEMVRLQGIRRS